MAEAFQPKFVDLVRNYSTTAGTGNFKLSAAVNGFTPFADALLPGDSFYYSAIGIDKPGEREVGHGTLLADGTISRDPVDGALTNFTGGTKSIALIAAAEWFTSIQAGAGTAPAGAALAATRGSLAEIADRSRPVLLHEAGREGIFVFDGSDLSAAVDADAAQGIHVAPSSDPTGASGAWVRCFTGNIQSEWFAANADGIALAIADAVAVLSGRDLDIGPGPHAVASDLSFGSKVRLLTGAQLKPAAGVKIHFFQGYVADDWSWCFDISAGGIVTGDKAPMGYVTPQQFGADPTDMSVDDRPAIEAATEYATLAPIRSEYAVGLPVKFPHPGTGHYYLTRTRPIHVARTTHWFTDAKRPLATQSGTEIRGADGLDAVCFCFFPGGNSAPAEYEPSNAPTDPTPGIGKSYSGLRSRFEDLLFLPESGATVRQGFVANAVCYLDRCGGSGFREAGCHLHAQTSGCIINAFAAPGVSNNGDTSTSVPASTMAYDGEGCVWGNVNGSRLTDCDFHNGVAAAGVNGGSYGVVMHGNNAGTVRLINAYCNGNQGAGILENTSIGTTIIGSSTAGNCWKVASGSNFYSCIKYHIADATNQPEIGASWQTFWVQTSATTADSAWTSGEAYHPCGSINVCSGSSRTTVLDGYTEGGIEAGIVARNMTEVRGGNACERAFWHAEFNGARVSPVGGTSPSSIGFKGQSTPGDADTYYGASFGAPNGYSGGTLIQFGDARDDAGNPASAIKLTWNGIRGRYEYRHSSSAARGVFGFTGTGYSGTGYSGITQSFAWANGIYVGDGSANGLVVSRLRACSTPANLTDANYGAAVKGDSWIITNPAAGDPLMARCTTGGAIGSTAAIEWLYANPKITVGTSAPSSPSAGDLWVDTN